MSKSKGKGKSSKGEPAPSTISEVKESGTGPTAADRKATKKLAESGATGDLLKSFSIDAPKLPKAIEDASMRSGGYPYDERMKRAEFEERLLALQIELVKLQKHNLKTGGRILCLYEGRDGSGKGSCIKAFNQHMNPRNTRTVALTKPTETERGQLYFQRYAVHLPTAGEVVLFDRSWYNRAGVERVMGFATPRQVEDFFNDVPEFERMLLRSGIRLVKYWFSITDEEQQMRFMMRIHDPMKQWKLSPMDLQSRVRWEQYTKAKEEMFERTSIADAPWYIVEGNDKKRARLNCIDHLLRQIPYTPVRHEEITLPDRVFNPEYERATLPKELYVPQKY